MQSDQNLQCSLFSQYLFEAPLLTVNAKVQIERWSSSL